MHAARIERSKRLQDVLALLSRGGRYSTRDIIDKTGYCAINSIVSELRANGYDIDCSSETGTINGRSQVVYYYRLVPPSFALKSPPSGAERRDGAG